MDALFLYGTNCTKEIWDALMPQLSSWDCEILFYPHAITREATCLSDLTEWVFKQTEGKHYDVIIGHSLGGLIALELVVEYSASVGRIICLDTNLKPAGAFFHDLMTKTHMEQYGQQVNGVMTSERPYYTQAPMRSLQEEFDYTPLLSQIGIPIYLLMRDRGQSDPMDHICELQLPLCALDKIQIRFVSDSCHMPMVENPVQLAEMLCQICNAETDK